jgi:hypothetical protein
VLRVYHPACIRLRCAQCFRMVEQRAKKHIKASADVVSFKAFIAEECIKVHH